MLDRLKIAGFKSILAQDLSFGRVNLFIGGNGSGKSNILEAIGLVSACLSRGMGDSDIGSKGLRITPPELMKSSFKGEKFQKKLDLHASLSGGIEYKVSLQSSPRDPLLRFFSESATYNGAKFIGRSPRGVRANNVSFSDGLDPSRGAWDQVKAFVPVSDFIRDEFSEFSKYVIYTPQTDFLRGRTPGKVDVPPVGLHGEGLSVAVSSLLSTWRSYRAQKGAQDTDVPSREIIKSCVDMVFLPGWARQFGSSRLNSLLASRDLANRDGESVFFIDKYMRDSRNKLSAYDSSEGTLFLLFAAIILAHKDAPRIFALDNVDNALNPRLTRKLIEQIIEVCSLSQSRGDLGARQVFLTSHNPTALDAFDLFNDETRIFVVNRNEHGHTQAERLVPPKNVSREKWIELVKGKNLSQMWLDGDIPGALGDL